MSMLNLKIVKGISTVIIASLVLAACGGGTVDKYTPAPSGANTPTPPSTQPFIPPTIPPSSSIAAEAAKWAAEPMKPGTVYYYCDCGTGREDGCVAGADTNAGTSAAAPRRTIGNAAARFSSLAVNDTVALCKGGAFNVTSTLDIGSTGRCPAGVACNDLREYQPTSFGTAKPILNWSTSNQFLFKFWGTGDIRILNIKLQGNGSAGNDGFYLYDSAHNITIGNVDLDNFIMAIYDESNAGNNSYIKVTGNNISNSHSFGYLGSSDNSDISYNYWLNNGSSNNGDHTIYLASHAEVRNVNVIGNYIQGQYGSTCLGAPVEGHFQVDGFLVKDNVVDISEAAWAPGCFGMEFNNETDDPHPIYHRNSIFAGNTIINGGNTGFNVTGCNGCYIENNLIIFTISDNTNHYGMRIPIQASRGGGFGDDINTANVIRNNNVYYASTANHGGRGIVVGVEGAGHIISNNSVVYASSSLSGQAPFSCYDYPLSLASYAFIDNNHCYSAASYNWIETGSLSLASWKSASSGNLAAGASGDAHSITSAPLFQDAAAYDFRPGTGSPLSGAGNNTNKSTFDKTGATRPNPPAIGAFEP